jgi:hypothetical protein
LAGYPTPRTPTGGAESTQRKQELGRTRSGGGDLESTALYTGLPDMKGWRLNPAFSAWIMGYSKIWLVCGRRASRLFSRSRKTTKREIGRAHV